MKTTFFKVLIGIFILANLGMAEYIKTNNEVYYKYAEGKDFQFKVKNVDLGTFKVLNDKYAKDVKNVYFSGNKSFEDVDAGTFEVLPEDYSKDKNNVYSPENGWIQRVNGANPKTIKVLNQFYLKDDKNVFFNDEKILGADANSFIALDKENGYAKDKNSVYYFGQKVEGANAKTFEVISDGEYSKDDKNVYASGEIIKGADPKTFREFPETSYSRDKNNLYYYYGEDKFLGKIDENKFEFLDDFIIRNGNEIYFYGNKLKLKDAKKFKLIKNTGIMTTSKIIVYGKNDENVYVVTPDDAPENIRIIENADKDTFEVMENNRYSKDKNNIYYLGNYGIVKLEDVDRVSFVISEQFPFSYDRKNVYYAGKKVDGVTSAGLKVIRRPNEPINFISDNKNLYRLVEIFDENNRELKSVKAVAVKNPKVDFKTFEIFDEWPNYFHDKNNVYYENKLYQIPLKKIEEADRNSFILLNSEFSKDNKNVYYYGNKIKDLNSEKFEFEGNNFIKDLDIVYFLKNKDKAYALKTEIGKETYEIVPLNVDTKSFKYSDSDTYTNGLTTAEANGYLQDKNGVYYFDMNKLNKFSSDNIFSKIEGADIHSFIQLMFGYAKDRNKVYFEGKELKGVDVKSFKIIITNGKVLVKDKNKIYKEF
ncbi:MAG: DKNYY domain-containing protein [Leptotrichia sp.]|nr:DKNYY domain-containing protein [Leptotrichia sp.]